MKITKQETAHVANLAKLYLSDEEIESMSKDLASIIEFADKLNELDTSSIEPSAHAFAVSNVFREDEVTGSYDKAELLKNAPSSDGDCYLVPKVVL